MNMPVPELLVPAADPDKLETALLYGADAVYVGGHALNLRAKSGGFSFTELPSAVATAHAHGAKLYFTLNLLAWEQHLPLVRDYLQCLADTGVDALIIADPGVLDLARTLVPHLPIHLSTQANTSNSAAVRFWQAQGVSRVNVARELSCRHIRALRTHAPDMELEVFAHGAMCMALSGRCLLSAHVNQRSANLGLCTHPCRFDYRVTGLRLEERLRPGAPMWEMYEDDTYTQIMGAEDLCLVKYLPWFFHVGIQSVKIEGRMKTTSYLAQVTDVYRTALRDLQQGRFRPGLYLRELRHSTTRPLSSGFFLPRRITLTTPMASDQRAHIVARIVSEDGQGRWIMDVKHRFSCHDKLELVLPGLNRPVLAEYGVETEDGTAVHEVHSGLRRVLRCDHPGCRSGILIRRQPQGEKKA
ncbi:peptidase U32 family protein [Desulfovibrionales bacterium]